MKIPLLIILSLLVNFCVAQENSDNKKLSFGYDYGESFPKGTFSKNDQSKLPLSRFTKQDTSKLNGYALKGVHFDLYVTYKIIRHVSIMASVCGDQNAYAINTLNSQFIQFYPPNTVAVTTGDNYYVVQYLIGPDINIPIIHSFSIELKALAGITTANYPSLTYIGLSPDALYSFPKGNGFGYTIGTGLKYSVGKSKGLALALHLNVNYAIANITYPNYSITYYTPGNVYLSSSTYNAIKSMPLNILQVTFGIALEL